MSITHLMTINHQMSKSAHLSMFEKTD